MFSKQSETFGIYLYYIAAAEQTSTAKLSAFFSGFQTTEQIVSANKNKIPCENTFNGNHFGIEDKNGSSKEEKKLLQVFLQNYDECFNTQSP